MSVLSARNKAEELVRNLACTEPPVEPDRVAKSLGLRIIYKDFSEPNISGLLMSTGGSSFVCINRTHSRVRRRFTAAHEIGHYVLHHKHMQADSVHVDRGMVVSYRDARSATGEESQEREANAFAAALLMPSKMLVKSARELCRMTPLVDYHLEQLAHLFAVSEQAMTIRLQQLGLVHSPA